MIPMSWTYKLEGDPSQIWQQNLNQPKAKSILWRFVKMRFVRQRKGKHWWNPTKTILQHVGRRHFKRSYVRACRCSLNKEEWIQNKTYFDESRQWDVYANVKGNTKGIKQHNSSKLRAQAFKTELCSCVSMCIKQKKNEFKKDILWRFVNMRVIRQSKGKHKGNQQKNMIQQVGRRQFKKELCLCVSMFIKQKKNEFEKDIRWRFVKMRCIRQSKRKTQRESRTNDSSKSRAQAFQKELCSCVSMCIKKEEWIHKNTYYDDSWKCD